MSSVACPGDNAGCSFPIPARGRFFFFLKLRSCIPGFCCYVVYLRPSLENPARTNAGKGRQWIFCHVL